MVSENLEIRNSLATGDIFAGYTRKDPNHPGLSLWRTGKKNVTDQCVSAVSEKFIHDVDGEGTIMIEHDGHRIEITVSPSDRERDGT